MFIKLTKLDGSPIWLNSVFVVTVEPRKGGGSVVVPVGDGLDYDVREAPEAVLAALGDAPSPAIIPIPTTDALVHKPVSIIEGPDDPVKLPTESPKPQESPKEVPDKEPVKKPAARKSTRRSVHAKAEEKKAEPAVSSAVEPAAKASDTMDVFAAAAVAGVLADNQVARLVKMKPRAVRSLTNTLTSQFRLTDPETAIADLEKRGVLKIDGTRVVWP